MNACKELCSIRAVYVISCETSTNIDSLRHLSHSTSLLLLLFESSFLLLEQVDLLLVSEEDLWVLATVGVRTSQRRNGCFLIDAQSGLQATGSFW